MFSSKIRCSLVAFALVAGGTAAARVPPVGSIPTALRVPGSMQPAASLHATGVQIYACQPGKDDPSRYAWTLKAPEAKLIDARGHQRARHYAGPTWEADDGSSVVGEVTAKDDGPDGGAIPWLLLKAKSTSGAGLFGKIGSIQRLHTSGGKAPADGCTAAVQGNEVRIPYTADYYFYAATP